MRLTEFLTEQVMIRKVVDTVDLSIMGPLPGILAEVAAMKGEDRQEGLNVVLECVQQELISWATESKAHADLSPNLKVVVEHVFANPRKVAKDILVFVRSLD